MIGIETVKINVKKKTHTQKLFFLFKQFNLSPNRMDSCGAGVFLRVPLTARRSNQSILKEINLEYPLEGLMLKLKL